MPAAGTDRAALSFSRSNTVARIGGPPCSFHRRGSRPNDDASEIIASRECGADSPARGIQFTAGRGHYLICLALKTTRLTLSRDGQAAYDGSMPAGTIYLAKPSTLYTAHIHMPFDFIKFQIPASYLDRQSVSPAGYFAPRFSRDSALLRDQLTEQLARALVKCGDDGDRTFLLCIGHVIATHVARLDLPSGKTNALQKWRLRLVEDYVDAQLHRNIGLADLAKAAGLSRMHFAAQFRSATGYRPREYLVTRRVERAKSTISGSAMPLAEVALSVGFSSQAHFSTVFKRVTGDTPARWRSVQKSMVGATSRNPHGKETVS